MEKKRLKGILKELKSEVEGLRLKNEELQRNAILTDRILECAAEGMAVCHAIEEEPHVRFTVWNERMTQITGYTMEYINRHGWYQTVYPDPEISAQAKERMQRMRIGDDLRSEEWEITRADGKDVTVSITTCLIPDKDNTVHVMALMTDVTSANLAIKDELTGLLNRRGFFTLAEQQAKIAARNKSHMALIFFDLNNLKKVNDEFGHEEGDQALRITANVLKDTFRESDIVARVGGDEFAVLMTNLPEEAQQEKIFQSVLDHLKRFNEQGERMYQLSVSQGLSQFKPEDPRSIASLLKEADNRMYQDKKKTKVLKQILSRNKSEQRRTERYTFSGGGAELDGKCRVDIINISIGGICFSADTPIHPGNLHTVTLHTPEGDEVFTGNGLVVWASEGDSDIGEWVAPACAAGLEFGEMDDKNQKIIEKVISCLSR